jgi:hypothetical protein
MEIRGATADNSASGLNVTDSTGNSKFFVRNDGNIGVWSTTPNSKFSIGYSTSNYGDLMIKQSTTIVSQRTLFLIPLFI